MAEPLGLAAIEERCQQATPGPWVFLNDMKAPWCFLDRIVPAVDEAIEEPTALLYGNGTYPNPDAEFAAHAREDIPALLADLRALRTANATLRAAAVRVLALHDPERCNPPLCRFCALSAALREGDHA